MSSRRMKSMDLAQLEGAESTPVSRVNINQCFLGMAVELLWEVMV